MKGENKMAAKKDLRALTIGKNKVFRERELEFEGAIFKFKQITRQQKAAMLKACRDEDGNIDPDELSVQSIILTCQDEDGEFVFKPEDAEAMLAAPAESGDYIDVFSVEAMKVIGLIKDEEDEKN